MAKRKAQKTTNTTKTGQALKRVKPSSKVSQFVPPEILDENEGAIYEPMVFKLAFLNKTVDEAKLQITLQGKVYDENIARLTSEKRAVRQHWENVARATMQRIKDLIEELKQKHKITDIEQYVFDDELGVIKEAPELAEEKEIATGEKEAISTTKE